MIIKYILIFLFAASVSAVLSAMFKSVAVKWGIIDVPRDRHKHEKPTPLLGGVAVFLAFWLSVAISHQYLLVGDLKLNHWIGVFVGSLLITVGGVLDDKFDLKPKVQLIFPLLACLAIILGGVSIEKISNPLGGYIYLSPLISGLFISAWMMGMMYTTKLLDGLDGLVSGVGVIASLIIFLFTVSVRWYQPDIAWAATVLGGTLLGFLYWNWNPAKMFLGEAGSLLVGFMLGVLSIISGGKIAIALLIMGVPIMDVAWTIIRRLLAGKNPLKTADRKHLHFRLLDAGLTVKQAVLVFYTFSLIFGLAALFLQSKGKLFLLLILAILMIISVITFNYLDKKAKTS